MPRLARLPDHAYRRRWGAGYVVHAYDTAHLAKTARNRLIDTRASFVAETVSSRPAKRALVERARNAGYIVWISYINVTNSPNVRSHWDEAGCAL